MKRGTPDHPKVSTLMRLLGLERWAVVGILESPWHFTARYASRGDIGRWSDEEIEQGIGWTNGQGDRPGRLIEALVAARWLDRSEEYRLVVHDWPDHCDESCKKTLKNRGEAFAVVKKVQAVSERFEKFPENSCLPEPSLALPLPEPSLASSPSADSGDEEPADPDVDGLLIAWNSTSGVCKARMPVSPERSRIVRARLRDSKWDWRAALAKFPLKCFGDGDWKPDLEWFIRKESVTKILEGKYDWSKTNGKHFANRVGPGQRYPE